MVSGEAQMLFGQKDSRLDFRHRFRANGQLSLKGKLATISDETGGGMYSVPSEVCRDLVAEAVENWLDRHVSSPGSVLMRDEVQLPLLDEIHEIIRTEISLQFRQADYASRGFDLLSAKPIALRSGDRPVPGSL